MPTSLRSYFASVCLVAVVASRANKANDFDLERTLLERNLSNSTYEQPIPNWMRGFYDDFERVPPQVEHHHWERTHERMPEQHSFYHLDDAEKVVKYHQPAVEYEVSHDERGFMLIPPSHEELIQVDPYQRQKAHQTIVV